MVGKIAKFSVAVLLGVSVLAAGSFNQQAEKDRKALTDYTVKKFSNPEKNKAQFFPYATDEELKNGFIKGLKAEDFINGSYAYDKIGREQYEEIAEMPPYEDAIDEGEELYNKTKGIKKCFPDPAIAGEYPKFDDKKGQVVTALLPTVKRSGIPKKGKWPNCRLTSLPRAKKRAKKFISSSIPKRLPRRMNTARKSTTLSAVT